MPPVQPGDFLLDCNAQRPGASSSADLPIQPSLYLESEECRDESGLLSRARRGLPLLRRAKVPLKT